MIINDNKCHLMYPKANDGFICIYLPNNSDKNDELVWNTNISNFLTLFVCLEMR